MMGNMMKENCGKTNEIEGKLSDPVLMTILFHFISFYFYFSHFP